MPIVEFIKEAGILIIPMFIWGAIAIGLIIDKWTSLSHYTKQLDQLSTITDHILNHDTESSNTAIKALPKSIIRTYLETAQNSLHQPQKNYRKTSISCLSRCRKSNWKTHEH
jgi:hypothetical protein